MSSIQNNYVNTHVIQHLIFKYYIKQLLCDTVQLRHKADWVIFSLHVYVTLCHKPIPQANSIPSIPRQNMNKPCMFCVRRVEWLVIAFIRARRHAAAIESVAVANLRHSKVKDKSKAGPGGKHHSPRLSQRVFTRRRRKYSVNMGLRFIGQYIKTAKWDKSLYSYFQFCRFINYSLRI